MNEGVSRVSVEIGGTELAFETGKLARQASGAVVVQAGETMVLGTATAGNPRDVDFLPLTVDIEERMYAAGKIPGSFFKREGRAGEKGTLTARMIDRPLRPLFPKGWHRETQLVSIPMSVDHVHPLDIAHGEIKKLCQLQRELQKKAGKEKVTLEAPKVDEGLLTELKDKFGAK